MTRGTPFNRPGVTITHNVPALSPAPAEEVERKLRRYATHFGGYIETKSISVPKKLLYLAADTIAELRALLKVYQDRETKELRDWVDSLPEDRS